MRSGGIGVHRHKEMFQRVAEHRQELTPDLLQTLPLSAECILSSVFVPGEYRLQRNCGADPVGCWADCRVLEYTTFDLRMSQLHRSGYRVYFARALLAAARKRRCLTHQRIPLEYRDIRRLLALPEVSSIPLLHKSYAVQKSTATSSTDASNLISSASTIHSCYFACRGYRVGGRGQAL